MRLTGLPLLVLVGIAAAAAVALTVRTWSRRGRRRPVTRAVACVCAEILVVLTAGLVVNRYQSFYPSWDVLSGNDANQVTVIPAGTARPAAPWLRAATGRWHLTQPPQVSVPGDYATRVRETFPLIVILHAPADRDPVRAAAQRTPGVVSLAVAPAAATSVADVHAMIAELRGSVRISAAGWAVVTDPAHQGLADGLGSPGSPVRATAGRPWPSALTAAADKLPPPLAAPLRP